MFGLPTLTIKVLITIWGSSATSSVALSIVSISLRQLLVWLMLTHVLDDVSSGVDDILDDKNIEELPHVMVLLTLPPSVSESTLKHLDLLCLGVESVIELSILLLDLRGLWLTHQHCIAGRLGRK